MRIRVCAAVVVAAAGLWGRAAAAQPAVDELRIIAPAAPGGGWDQTARAMQQALLQAGLVRIAPVENVPGAAGTIGLARFIGAEHGRRDTVMVSGLIMLGGIVTSYTDREAWEVALREQVQDRGRTASVRPEPPGDKR